MDQLLELLTDAALKMAVILIPIIFAVLTRYLVLFLNKQIDSLERQCKETELLLLREFANIAVLAAEQVLDNNPEKFNYASRQLSAMAQDVGIPLNKGQAFILIESSVREIRNQLPLSVEILGQEELLYDGTAK